jgi:hypothetical protein
MLSGLNKTVKTNAGAITTSVITLLVVCYYLFVILPLNREKLDHFNKSSLAEFEKQFNHSLQDYANTINENEIDTSITNKVINLLGKSTHDSIKNAIKLFTENKQITIRTISIDSVVNIKVKLKIYRTISFKLDSICWQKLNLKISTDQEKISNLQKNFFILKTIEADKYELKNRLKGATLFSYWFILDNQNKSVLLNNSTDKSERDSITEKGSTSGIANYNFSEKRFYTLSGNIKGTDNHFFMAAGVDKNEFENSAKKIDERVLTLFLFLFLVLLLSLPLIKSLISSKKESLTQFDLFGTTACLGLIMLLTLVFLFTNFLSNYKQKLVEEELIFINNYTQKKLVLELNTYKESLNKYRVQLNNPNKHLTSNDTLNPDNKDTNALVNKNIQNFFKLDAQGNIIKSISKPIYFSIRKNFSDRDYFKALKHPKFNTAFSAVYSKYDNRFKFVYIEKDTIEKKFTGNYNCFAYIPEFNRYGTFKNGTGFLLCNKKGRVLYCSDTTKNLAENIYLNSNKSTKLLELFRFRKTDSFELNYNGKQTLFYGQQINKFSDFPIFLITYKNLEFENSLIVYSFLTTFFIGFCYALLIVVLAYIYSVIYHLGSIPLVSKTHFYWLFPDNSRKQEYNFLTIVTLAVAAIFLLLLFFNLPSKVFLSVIAGINIAFFHFFVLSQRQVKFSLSAVRASLNVFLPVVLQISVCGIVLPFLLYSYGFIALSFAFCIGSQLLFLLFYKKQTFKKEEVYNDKNYNLPNVAPYFSRFFSSVLLYHYLIVPSIFVLAVFNSQINKTQVVNKYLCSIETTDKPKVDDEWLFNKFVVIKQPSIKVMEEEDAQNLKEYYSFQTLLDYINIKINTSKFFFFWAAILVLVIIIYSQIAYFNKRYFLVDLAEAYRLNYFKKKDEFINLKVIVPPFIEEDFKNFEKFERSKDDEENKLNETAWLEKIEYNVLRPLDKIEWINLENQRKYKTFYLNIWSKLSIEQKFVLHDFAKDHFVNYKNKPILLELMLLGYVIADPLTGRLRVINYGFRNFVIEYTQNNPTEIIDQDDKSDIGGFSRFRIPLLIIGAGGLLLMIYLYKESFNQLLFIGGSLISALGLIGKLMDTYKK